MPAIAFPNSPTLGQVATILGVTYTWDGTKWNGFTAGGTIGKVLQVVQATELGGNQAVTNNAPTAVLSAVITPSSASSRVLVLINAYVAAQNTTSGWANILRGGTPIFRGNLVGSRQQVASGFLTTNDNGIPLSIIYVDSPATTSATTYALALNRDAATGTVYLNRTHTDTNAATYGRGAASIVLIEIGP